MIVGKHLTKIFSIQKKSHRVSLQEFLQALTNAVNTFADRGDIDYEAVNKPADIIPIMQKLDSKEVAKAIVKEFHNDNKGLSYDVSK